MKKENKATVIEQIISIIGEYAYFYLVDIVALNATNTNRLRRKCYEQGIKLFVVKNTLFKKAVGRIKRDFSILNPLLKGSTAIMFSNSANSPAKLIKAFSKKADVPRLKAAYVQELFYIGGSAEHIDLLSSLKNKDELICDVISLLQLPIRNIVSALQSGENTIHKIFRTLSKREDR